MEHYFELGLRWLLGAQMIFWGLNGFFHWLPTPPPSEAFGRFVQACIDSRFIMPTVKILEILGGAFLLAGLLVPGALLLLAPVLFVITGLHVFHNPRPWVVLLTCTLPYIILLAWHAPKILQITH